MGLGGAGLDGASAQSNPNTAMDIWAKLGLDEGDRSRGDFDPSEDFVYLRSDNCVISE